MLPYPGWSTHGNNNNKKMLDNKKCGSTQGNKKCWSTHGNDNNKKCWTKKCDSTQGNKKCWSTHGNNNNKKNVGQ